MTSSKPSARKVGVTCATIISLLQFGQISMVGTTEQASLVLMTRSFRLTTCRGDKKAHPGLGVCESEKQELIPARSLCDSGSIKSIVRLILKRVDENERRRHRSSMSSHRYAATTQRY